jgi:ABC-2 type transport system ATP-binding protein
MSESTATYPSAPEAAPVIAVQELSVHYGRRPVLTGLSFTVRRGSVYALLGRNGTGKSSLVRCLLGGQKPQNGGARLLGRDAWRDRRDLMRRVGVVPEEPDAPPEMTARELAAFCRGLYPSWDESGVFARLARFGVPEGTPFGRLSKGQKGAVMLTLALGHSPELLVLDDPTLGLDVVARNAVFGELIGDLADHGTTVFITTHDLTAVEGIADRVAILKDGRLAVDEETSVLKERWARPLEEIFTAVAAGEGEAHP